MHFACSRHIRAQVTSTLPDPPISFIKLLIRGWYPRDMYIESTAPGFLGRTDDR